MNGPSKHLTWLELSCHDKDRTPYPAEWRETRAAALGVAFEMIRAECGNKPIRVLSGYRTADYNASIPGAAKKSQHVQGRALDLKPPAGMTIDQFYAAVRKVALDKSSPIHGLGRYPTFVHVDVRDRPDGRVTVWQGERAWAEGKRA